MAKVFGFDFAPAVKEHPEFADEAYIKYLAKNATPLLFDGVFCVEQWLKLDPDAGLQLIQQGESPEQADLRRAEKTRAEMLKSAERKGASLNLLDFMRSMQPVYVGEFRDPVKQVTIAKSQNSQGPQPA